MNCLFSGEDCFLAKKSWQKILSDQDLMDQNGVVSKQTGHVGDLYFANLARLPSIVKKGYILREARRHGMPVDEANIRLLICETVKLHQDMLAWFVKFQGFAPTPIEIPSQDPASLFDTVLSHANVWLGGMYMSYWATLLILQECLNQCRYAVDYSEHNKELALNILRSIESVAVGMMGPFRVGYAIRIAYEFVDLRSQLWLATLLQGFEKTYAATSATDYPLPGENDYQWF
jgi:hypothetical protein